MFIYSPPFLLCLHIKKYIVIVLAALVFHLFYKCERDYKNLKSEILVVYHNLT